MKEFIVKLSVILSVIEGRVAASVQNDDVPELMQELNTFVRNIVEEEGFSDISSSPNFLSRRNGGWAYYSTFEYCSEQSLIRLCIDVRTADHPSKPNLADKNKKRAEILQNKFGSENDYEVLDMYYKSHSWGAQYFIGKGDQYSDPVTSLTDLGKMLKGKLHKILDKYSSGD